MITTEAIIEILSVQPKISIAIFSVLVTFVSTLAQKWLTNQEHLKAHKKRQKEIQAEIGKTKDPTIMQELNAEMMKISGALMKASMKPLMVTFVPIIILFGWLRSVYVPLLGNSWIWYYFGYSFAANMIFRKVLDVA